MKDPKEFAKSYKLRKKKPTNKKSAADNIPCGKGLSGKICRVNNKKLNKSYGYNHYDNAKVRVPTYEHDAAEQTADPNLVEYLKSSVEGAELQKIPFQKGMLTVHQKDRGLYSGFFADNHGQVIEKFDDMSIPMLAKALITKNLYQVPKTLASETRNDNITQAVNAMPARYVKIKYGDFELEIKKSLTQFINDFRHQKDSRVSVMKAIQSWRRNTMSGKVHKSDLSAAQELLQKWDDFNEEFYQILEALNRNGQD